MALTKTQVSQLYVSIFGRASEGAGNTYWQTEVEGMSATATAMLETPAAKEYFGTSLDTDQAFIEHIYKNTLGKTYAEDKAGIDYWVSLLADGMSKGEVVAALIVAAQDPANAGAAQDMFNNKVEVSDYTATKIEKAELSDLKIFQDLISDVTADGATVNKSKEAVDAEAAEPEVPSVPGQTFMLTEGRDNITGTSGDDTFYGDVGQNTLGAVSNALDSGDIINGGAGYDTLYATMMNSNEVDGGLNQSQAPMPRIDNVEEIRLEAMESVVFDANHVNNEKHYASDSSRDDLVITNVDISSTQITNEIVLEMKDTQQFSDMEVYFNQSDLKAAPDETTGSAQVIIQVADGAQTDASNPIGNMTFDLSFTQDGKTYTFENLESTDGTYAGLKTAIEVALAEEGLTKYEVELAGEFTSFTTASNKSVDLDYTGNYITITDKDGEEFTDINFAPEQKAGSPVAILLAQSEVNANEITTTHMVESTVIFDNVGRGSNGGEFIVGSTSSSKSSTGVERINVIVENSSVVSDISSTNDALKHITLTNGKVKGNFVLANNDFDDVVPGIPGATDFDNHYGNVVQDNLLKEGLTSIVATNFDGNIVLGRDNDIVDLKTLSANVNGNVTYNATLNDNAYIAVTGSGNDVINITLDDNRKEDDSDTDTSVTISTGAGNDTITVDEDNTSLENTTATIDAGAGNDVIHGNDVSVTVEAGSGNDVVYAENTGAKALANIATSGLFGEVTPATDSAAAIHPAGAEIHLLAGKQVQVTIAVDGAAAGLLTNGYESAKVEIKAASGALTTLADLNNAVLKAINEDTKLNKIVTAYVDENNNVAIKYLVDGAQLLGAVSLEITDPVTAHTSVTTAMLKAYRDLINDSTYTDIALLANWNTVVGAAGTTASTFTHEGATIDLTTTAGTAGTAGDTVTVTIGDVEVTYTSTGAAVGDDDALADALIAKGFYAESDGDGVVSVITDKEVLLTTDGTTVATILNDVPLDETDIVMLEGTDSDTTTTNTLNANVVNGGSGDDVIVLSSDATANAAPGVGVPVDYDTVVFTGYNQGNDTIVHFESGIDKLDFTAYLTGTVAGNGVASSSAESEVTLPSGAAVGNDTFTANSINLIQFNALDGVTATQTFESLTEAQLAAALNADTSANTVASTNGIYQSKATSVLIIEDAANANGAVAGDLDNAGTYKAYEVTYTDQLADNGGVNPATNFTVKFIGQFDLGDDTLATTDLTQLV